MVFQLIPHISHQLHLTNRIFNIAASRALQFPGPALITGDLDWKLKDLPAKKQMQLNG